ncbi:unnamed protein product [Clonostachys chloroleuca]|uniref:Dihydroxy-acid dehydratase n=1 Tax=Clonostachys chloroleuca TaxID=1926264 RepID=A0AA35LQN8_9HYPO|nr:unnamed protein product [Clonostachys chloroleuca]
MSYCEGCTCGRSNEAVPVAAAAPEIEITRPVRSFTAPNDLKEPVEERIPAVPLRSKVWFNNPDDVNEITDLNRPLIGIAQTGSDLTPCNKHHLQLARRVRDGIIAAGGTPIEFPCHPIQEGTKRPSATLDRNLAYLSLVEVLYGYPLDGVVLLSGCDKTTPALLMAASTVNIPSIVMNVGPMLNAYAGSELVGSGTVVWNAREALASGRITRDQAMQQVALSAPSVGHCNTMGTASTMNALAEALGMALPGSSSIPAVYRERGACAYQTGRRIVDLVRQDVKPSDILTKDAFENAIAVCTAIGGSTNAPIHLNALAKHIGVQLNCDDWERIGYNLPLLLNVQPAGAYLCEEYHRAGGLPAVVWELLNADKLPHPDALTLTGRSISENCKTDQTNSPHVIFPFEKPLRPNAGFLHLKGTLFNSAIMKTSVISQAFTDQYLSNPTDPMAFEGPVAIFNGPEEYDAELEHRKDIGANSILIMRGAGPIGYPGAAEVVNMHAPGRLIKQGIVLPCIGDGRQSGTSGTPSILHASPEAAAGGMLGYLKDGDWVRIDLKNRSADVRLTPEEIAQRKKEMGLYPYPAAQTPWQEMYRESVGDLSEGMILKKAVKFQRIAQNFGVPRRNH